MSKTGSILIMAAGTGGHVFPALAIADQLRRRGHAVDWLGTARGMENELLAESPYTLHRISVSGLVGSGLSRKLRAPLMVAGAWRQARRILGQLRPDCVLGMGGFVCGPGGLAARSRGIPLLLHEQNAVPGFTNRLLAPLAQRIIEAFPRTFSPGPRVRTLGNPLRAEIIALADREAPAPEPDRPLQILVLGGSQGSAAINDCLPEVLAGWGETAPQVWHQTGAAHLAPTRERYQAQGFALSDSLRVQPFIENMAEAYAWGDVVVARAGASTVSELAAVGRPAILVPYPHHRDQQQLHNARWLCDGGAARLMTQDSLTAQSLLETLRELHLQRQQLAEMAASARRLRRLDSAERIADVCEEFMDV